MSNIQLSPLNLVNRVFGDISPGYSRARLRFGFLQGLAAVFSGTCIGVLLLASMLPKYSWAILLLPVFIFPFVVMITGNLHRLLLALIVIDIPLQLDVNPGYRADVVQFGSLSGMSLSVTTLALAVLYTLWLTDHLGRIGSPRRLTFRGSMPLAAYVILVTLSALVAFDVNMAFFQVFLLWQMFMLFLYLVNFVRTRRDVAFIVTVLLFGLALESMIMIGHRVIGRDIYAAGGLLSLTMFGSRVGGTLGHPNAAGSFLAMLLAPAVGVLLTPARRELKLLAASGIALGSIALALTLSRGSWIAFGLSIMILCLFAWRRGWLSPTVPAVLFVLALVMYASFHGMISERILESDGGSAQGRLPLMQLAFQMIGDKPVMGVGANNFGIMIKQYATPEYRNVWLYSVHNQYLLIWAEAGLITLVAYLGFLLVTLRRGWLVWMRADRYVSPIVLGCVAAIIGHMVHLNVDLFIHRPQVQLLFLISGLVTAICHMDVSVNEYENRV